MTTNPYTQPSDPAKRKSAAMTDGADRAAARAMLKAIGFDWLMAMGMYMLTIGLLHTPRAVTRFSPMVGPEDETLVAAIEASLNA
jgi:hypothetical protein